MESVVICVEGIGFDINVFSINAVPPVVPNAIGKDVLLVELPVTKL